MDLIANNSLECHFLISSLENYFNFLSRLKSEVTEEEILEFKTQQDICAGILSLIDQYHKAYPETKDDYFYIELDQGQTECLLKSLAVLREVKKEKITLKENSLIDSYSVQAKFFLSMYDKSLYTEEYVKEVFSHYKSEIKKYCEEAIETHIKDGNKETYVFAIYLFPGHHYQLVTLNTVENLQAMTKGDGFEEAKNYGLLSEVYNPACFDREFSSSKSYDEVENRIKKLFSQFYDLTDGWSQESYKEGSADYNKIKQLIELANQLFIKNSVDVLKEIDFSGLNRSENFCVIPTFYESDDEEIYGYIQELLGSKEKFDLIFPNAFRVAEDYIDFNSSDDDEICEYLVSYIVDLKMQTIPKDRYYTDEKAYDYEVMLQDYPETSQKYILPVLENLVAKAKPNPFNDKETCFFHFISKESLLAASLLSIIANQTKFLPDTQERLISMLKKVVVGMVPTLKNPSDIHRSLIYAIKSTDKKKYPEEEFDVETGYVLNFSDYFF